MAGDSSFLPAELCLSKRVQEMALNGEDPPPLYICRDSEEEDDSNYSSSSSIPMIDFSLISSANQREEEEEELRKLESALSSWGCFQAIGHGISSSTLNEIRKVGREFFKQPMEKKKKQLKGVNEFEGYGGDPVPYEGQFLDWSDRLFLDVYPLDKRNISLWPSFFTTALESYTLEIKKFTEVVSKAMAKSLKLEEECFLKQFGERAMLQARFNYYSCCKRADKVLGLKAHADGSGYTLILQDDDDDNDVEGLQIQKHDHHNKWLNVASISDAIFVLMGDQMEIMSNGRFKSPMHRVVTNASKERLSIAMFYTPEPGKEIGPEPGLFINQKTSSPILFHNVKNYAGVHWDYYQKGERALHVAQKPLF